MASQADFIPFSLPLIGQEEIDEVVDTLRSGWITTGPKTAQFEREFADYVQAPHALAVNSATAALHLALAALEVGPGDEVITTPLTFCSTVNTILQVGATPVLADIGPDGNIDPESVAELIGPRTRAILPVHMGGLPCDMDAIWELARSHGLFVIEDAAHAVGSRYRGYPIGAGDPARNLRSNVVCFSFYATKNLTTGEGGMAVTHDVEVYEKMRLLCLHGISKDAWGRYSEAGSWYYEVVAPGFKYNLSDIQSAIGIHQLRKQETFVRRRTEIAQAYNSAFSSMSELELPADDRGNRHCWHLYALRLNPEKMDPDRAAFLEELRRRGIGASVHFIPIPLHPCYRELMEDARNDCPRALALYPRLVSLPIYPSMTDGQVDRVARVVREVASSSVAAPTELKESK